MKEITTIAFLFFGVVLIGYIIIDLIKTWKEK
jgi:hypothetical protein